MTRKTDATIDNNKRERVSFGGHRRRLAVHDKEEGYEYYWFNDVEDRIQRALDAGYEFVLNKHTEVGDKDVHNGSSKLDSRVSKRLRDYTVYLMRIKKEYWDEDRAVKARLADQVDEAIFGGGADKVTQSYGLDVRYKPR